MFRRLWNLLRRRTPATRPRRSVEKSPLDHSPDEQLLDGPGELWVGFRTGEDEAVDEAFLEALVAHVESSGHGEWTGQSGGSGQRDVTFEMHNQRRGARQIAAFFARNQPTRDFWISSDYQSTFDRV